MPRVAARRPWPQYYEALLLLLLLLTHPSPYIRCSGSAEGWKTCAGWTAWEGDFRRPSTGSCRPSTDLCRPSPRAAAVQWRLGASAAARLVSGGSRSSRNHGRRGGAGGGGKPGELQAAARFAQRPGCSRDHLHLRGGERGAVAAVALAGEHRGGAYLRCTRLQAGRTGLQAVCTGSQAFVRSASVPLPLPLTLTLALTPVLPPTHRKPSRKRSPRWPPHRPQRACTAPGHRLSGLCGAWLQPLLRTSGDAACLGAEHRRLHWP